MARYVPASGPDARASEAAKDSVKQSKIWQVIGASAAGTMIEWYDFYIFGSLAATVSPLFYPKDSPTLALIAYLATFAVGFIVRPFGALFFGRIGDLVGRKYAFLVTLLLMGGATAAVGFLPTFETIGYAAPPYSPPSTCRTSGAGSTRASFRSRRRSASSSRSRSS
jgi:MFS family permease